MNEESQVEKMENEKGENSRETQKEMVKAKEEKRECIESNWQEEKGEGTNELSEEMEERKEESEGSLKDGEKSRRASSLGSSDAKNRTNEQNSFERRSSDSSLNEIPLEIEEFQAQVIRKIFEREVLKANQRKKEADQMKKNSNLIDKECQTSNNGIEVSNYSSGDKNPKGEMVRRIRETTKVRKRSRSSPGRIIMSQWKNSRGEGFRGELSQPEEEKRVEGIRDHPQLISLLTRFDQSIVSLVSMTYSFQSEASASSWGPEIIETMGNLLLLQINQLEIHLKEFELSLSESGVAFMEPRVNELREKLESSKKEVLVLIDSYNSRLRIRLLRCKQRVFVFLKRAYHFMRACKKIFMYGSLVLSASLIFISFPKAEGGSALSKFFVQTKTPTFDSVVFFMVVHLPLAKTQLDSFQLGCTFFVPLLLVFPILALLVEFSQFSLHLSFWPTALSFLTKSKWIHGVSQASPLN